MLGGQCVAEMLELCRADDWRCHARLVQQPRERDLRGCDASLAGDLAHALDDIEVGRLVVQVVGELVAAGTCRQALAGARATASENSARERSFVAAIALFVRRFFQTRKPIEPGFVWSVAAVFLWLQFAPAGKASDAYVATAALILAATLIETSYVLAYHDELTGIRGRRAFNESLLSLDQQYAIAIVDIDHFKKFNDTYGHDVGDQVLCMVAKRLSQAGGGGQAFRCGGEEFAIVFRNTSAKDAFEHLDALRQIIEKSMFRVRGSERRAERIAEKGTGGRSGPRNELRNELQNELQNELRNELRTSASDRRRPAKKKTAAASPNQSPDRLSDHLSVTVSIGVAEPSTRYRQPEQVIQAADQALYRAKNKGRNRVELASTAPLRLAEGKRAKASRL